MSTDTWRPVGGRLAGHTAEVMALSVSRDGRTLATGSADGTIRLFDLATRRPLGAPLPAVINRLVEPRFTPDGAFLFAITDDRAGLPLGHAPVLVGAARLRRRRPHAHPRGVERRPAGPRVRASLRQAGRRARLHADGAGNCRPRGRSV